MNHREAYAVLERAWREVLGRAPSAGELAAVAAVAFLESRYGRAWKGPAANSHNWGAIFCAGRATADKPCADGCVPQRDTAPNASGASVAYVGCLRVYASDLDGAKGLVRTFTRRKLATTRTGPSLDEAIAIGSTDAVAAYMWATGYYAGFGADVETRIANYATAMQRGIDAAARELGRPAALERGTTGRVSYRRRTNGEVADPWDSKPMQPGWFELGERPAPLPPREVPEPAGGDKSRAGADGVLTALLFAFAIWRFLS